MDSLENFSSGKFLVTVVSKSNVESDYVVDLDEKTVSSLFILAGRNKHVDANCIIESGTVGKRFIYSFKNPHMPAVRLLPIISKISRY